MAKHMVKCKYCGQTFDANTTPFAKPSSNRYAHKKCHDEYMAIHAKDVADEKELYAYIDKLFNKEYNFVAVQRAIKKFIEEYHFTYSGIRKSLMYFYEVQGNSVEKANGRINIVPYVYKDAYNYYYSLWEAKQKNADTKIELYIPQEKVVKIPVPQRNLRKRKLFTFLDEEENNGE